MGGGYQHVASCVHGHARANPAPPDKLRNIGEHSGEQAGDAPAARPDPSIALNRGYGWGRTRIDTTPWPANHRLGRADTVHRHQPTNTLDRTSFGSSGRSYLGVCERQSPAHGLHRGFRAHSSGNYESGRHAGGGSKLFDNYPRTASICYLAAAPPDSRYSTPPYDKVSWSTAAVTRFQGRWCLSLSCAMVHVSPRWCPAR